MNKLVVEYNADNGQAFPDNKAKEYVDNIAETFVNAHIVIGTDLLITLFRCAVAEKKIKHTEIEFLFKGETIKINKDGTYNYWPSGFGDAMDNALETLLLSR